MENSNTGEIILNEINSIENEFLCSTACCMDEYDEWLIAKLKAKIASDEAKLAELKSPAPTATEHVEEDADSLARAMQIALEKAQHACASHDFDTVKSEMSLYSICANALHEACAG